MTPTQVEDQLFPGLLDRGTPLIIKEHSKWTVIGIFHLHLEEDPIKGPGIFSRLHPDLVNWITNTAEWTHDSTCETFTACSCGITSPNSERHKRSADSTSSNLKSEKLINRVFHGSDVPVNKYPWEGFVLNRLQEPCIRSHNVFKENDPDGVKYDICTGSLISNRHVLTSAECLLKNKQDIENQKDSKKTRAEYSKRECIFVILGFEDKEEAINNEEFYTIEQHIVHNQAFTDVNEYNYNLGEVLQIGFLLSSYLIQISAILELSAAVDFSVSMRPICMPHWATKPYQNDRGTIAGWGWDGQSWGKDLKEVNTVIWTQEFCTEIFKHYWTFQWQTITK